MSEVIVYIEVHLEHREGPFLTKERLAEEVAEYISGEVYPDDSRYEQTYATGVTEWVEDMWKQVK